MILSDLEYYASDKGTGEIHITDSYKVSKKDMISIVKELRKKYPNNIVLQNRSDKSLKREWMVHNLLYKFGYEVKRTKDVGLDYPQPKKMRIGYRLVAIIASIIIK